MDTDELVEHPLNDEWSLYFHRPQDANWSVDSYLKIVTLDTVEQVLELMRNLQDVFITNSMLFLMKRNILPVWEDPKNCRGGCFSFKVRNEMVPHVWHQLTYAITGCFVSSDGDFMEKITGITLSPKKGNCIVKIWMEDSSFQNASLIRYDIDGMDKHGCLFVEHNTKTNFNKK
jgi:hypothetical protein